MGRTGSNAARNVSAARPTVRTAMLRLLENFARVRSMHPNQCEPRSGKVNANKVATSTSPHSITSMDKSQVYVRITLFAADFRVGKFTAMWPVGCIYIGLPELLCGTLAESRLQNGCLSLLRK